MFKLREERVSIILMGSEKKKRSDVRSKEKFIKKCGKTKTTLTILTVNSYIDAFVVDSLTMKDHFVRMSENCSRL